MIVFLNGAFGAGKTTVAEALAARLPGSLLFDPEEVGFFLRKVLGPADNPADFQDLPPWRALTVTTARLLRATYGRDLIVPMTIWRADYFAEVAGGLRQIDACFHHFCLTTPAAVLHARLRARGEGPGSFAWAHVAPCVAAFRAPAFATHIPTADQPVAALVEMILRTVTPAGIKPGAGQSG